MVAGTGVSLLLPQGDGARVVAAALVLLQVLSTWFQEATSLIKLNPGRYLQC